MNSSRLKVLIVALESWPSVARLPKALQQAGFEVGALGYNSSYLAVTRHLDRWFPIRSRRLSSRVFRQLIATIEAWRPHFIIPGDDRTVLFCHQMLQRHREGIQPLPSSILETLRLSFGNFDWLADAASKRRTLLLAQKLGLKTPRYGSPDSVAEAVSLAQELGWPVVLKKSTSWGGGGVSVCENAAQVAATFNKYREATRWKGKLKARLIQARGWSQGPDWFPADLSVTVNETIRGDLAMMAVAAAGGRILAQVAAIKIQCHPAAHSPSSVVRFIQDPGMMQTVAALVGHWGATGLLGFDFMLAESGEISLIECNPRPISLCFIGWLSGTDLCRTLHQHLAGREIPPPKLPLHEEVAFFPQEWRRDPRSPHLLNGYHDVPWDDPGLVRKLIKARL